MSESVGTDTLLQIALESVLMDVHTWQPGKVQNVDMSKQVVDVQPMQKRRIKTIDGDDTSETLPVLQNVPLVCWRGGGAFMSFPVAKGDFVMLAFAERPITVFRQTGQIMDPGHTQMHSLNGAVALTGLFPNAQKLQSAHAQNAVFGFDGSSAQLHAKPDGTLALGASDGNAQDFVALAALVKQNLDALHTYLAAINAVITGAPIVTPAPASSDTFQAALATAVALPANVLQSIVDVKAAKVKAT